MWETWEMAEPKLGQIALKLILLDSLLLGLTVGSYADSQRAYILALVARLSLKSFLDFWAHSGCTCLLQASESPGYSGCSFTGEIPGERPPAASGPVTARSISIWAPDIKGFNQTQRRKLPEGSWEIVVETGPGRKCLKVGRGCGWGKGTLNVNVNAPESCPASCILLTL